MPDIVESLNAIGQIGPGYTYNVGTGEIVCHGSWYGWYTRYTGGEDKKSLYIWLYKLHTDAFSNYANSGRPSRRDEIKTALINSRKGLENLKLTYQGSEEVNFQPIIDMIDCFMAQIHGSYCYTCKRVHTSYRVTGNIRGFPGFYY